MKNFARLAAAAVVLLAAAGCAKKDAGPKKSAEKTVFPVRTAAVERRDIETYIDANGDVEAKDQIEVYPDIGGTLVRLYVNLGSSVRRGQIIAEVDPSTPGARYTLSRIEAPISGSVVSVPFQAGSKVSPSSPVATIGDTARLQISARVPERYVGIMQKGLRGEVSLEAYPGEKFAATVVRVSPVVDSVSRTKQIHLEFDEGDPRINAGMFAKIRLYTQKIKNALAIPANAVQINLDQNFVYVVSDGTAHKRVVRLGPQVEGTVQVLEGLDGTERIVTQGGQILTDGAQVNDISEKSEE